MSTIPVKKRRPRSEKQIDETIDDSFPASDPPSYSRTARSGAPKRGEETADANREADEHCAPDGKDHDNSDRKDDKT